MATARGQAVDDGSSGTGPRKRAKRRGLSPATIVVGALIALVALGTMFLALSGIWPPKGSGNAAAEGPQATATTLIGMGLVVEKAGNAELREGQFHIPVKVTNRVQKAPAQFGTPTLGAEAPKPEPALIITAHIKVACLDVDRQVSGYAYGDITQLPYGESRTVDVVATGIEQCADFDAAPDYLFTDKDEPAPSTPGR